MQIIFLKILIIYLNLNLCKGRGEGGSRKDSSQYENLVFYSPKSNKYYNINSLIKRNKKDLIIEPSGSLSSSQEQQPASMTCPACGFLSSELKKLKHHSKPKSLTSLHQIIACYEYQNVDFKFNSKSSIKSFRCRCKYLKIDYEECQSLSSAASIGKPTANHQKDLDIISKENALYQNYEDELLDSTLGDPLSTPLKDDNSNINECLVAHIGMAVKGYNLIYKQWISEENCFNLCLTTTVLNGHSFDCKSFEHWQTVDSASCNINGNSNTDHSNETVKHFVPRICSQGNLVKIQNNKKHFSISTGTPNPYYKNNKYESSYIKRAIVNKIEYCVLSNMTIETAGRDFAENNAVTYYEILCKSKIVYIFFSKST